MAYRLRDERYEAEKKRLLDALGKLTDGGLVEGIEHIGATSIPGLLGSECVDIGLSVWPFPLPEGASSELEKSGYQVLKGYSGPPQQRFWHTTGLYKLFVFEPGANDWYDFVLVSDYLRHVEHARADFSARKADPALDHSALFSELLPKARGWWVQHHAFRQLEAIAGVWRDAPFEWSVSGGWALDLFAGSVQRVHHDVDIVVSRTAQLDLQAYLTARGWKLIAPFQRRLELWPTGTYLELPRHQVHAHRDGEFIDILLTDMEGVWRYRRDPAVLRSIERATLRSDSGIPYLAPELVLLFKSKNTSSHERAKDDVDFETTLPLLDSERRAWLRWALTVTSPEHSWIERLV